MLGAFALGETPLGYSGISPLLTADPASPYVGVVGGAVSIDLDVTDTDSEFVTLSLLSGSLPTGVTASQTLPYMAEPPYTVVLSGNYAAVGTFNPTFRADDGVSEAEDLPLSFTVTDGSSSSGGDSLGRMKSARMNLGLNLRF